MCPRLGCMLSKVFRLTGTPIGQKASRECRASLVCSQVRHGRIGAICRQPGRRSTGLRAEEEIVKMGPEADNQGATAG
jgi:hypothetical protein